MSKLTEFQIYVAIKGCEATAAKHRAIAGHGREEREASERAAKLRRELQERLRALLAQGKRIPEMLRTGCDEEAA